MNPSTEQAQVLVDEFARCGVREAVIAPGSRSAPLALALYGDSRVRLHVRIDERSAGFLAVGLAKVSRRPVALVCTSGTAAANFHPAVLEAAHAHVPLVVLTADRPPELRQTGANQTIDQIKLYGGAVRLFAEVAVAAGEPGQVGYWRSLARRAYAAASTGPVHLNVPFREPLVPDAAVDAPPPPSVERPLEPIGSLEVPLQPPGVRLKGPFNQADSAGLDPLKAPFNQAAVDRGAVVVGEGAVDPAGAIALAEARGWPVLSEPTGGARRGPNCVSTYSLLLADTDFAAAHRPDLVVSVGKPGLSRSLFGWIATAIEHVVVDPYDDWADPTRTATAVLAAVPEPADRREPTDWLRSWQVAEKRARAAIDAVLDEGDVPSEPRLARDLVAAVPDRSLLFVGSSKPIRDVEFAAAPRDGVRLVGNRGVSGIDGLVSSAIGAALAWQRDGGGHAYALLGDLAYLHDRNGLILGPDEPRPDLTIVVVDNDGGGLFSLLPQAGLGGFERIFGTPHGVDLAADATAAGVAVAEPATASAFLDSLAPAAGLRVVRVRTDRADSAGVHRRLVAAVMHSQR